jgi:hypothetical protein
VRARKVSISSINVVAVSVMSKAYNSPVVLSRRYKKELPPGREDEGREGGRGHEPCWSVWNVAPSVVVGVGAFHERDCVPARSAKLFGVVFGERDRTVVGSADALLSSTVCRSGLSGYDVSTCGLVHVLTVSGLNGGVKSFLESLGST